MPPRAREPPLLIGDIVSVAVRQFGEEYARGRGGRQWASENVRDEATVMEKHDNKFLLDFGDGEEKRWWVRRLLRFVRRTASAEEQRARRAALDSDDEGSGGGEEPEDVDGDHHVRDEDTSSSEVDEERHITFDDDDPDNCGDGVVADVDGWVRNDEQFVNERERQGWNSTSPPVWNACPAKCLNAEDACDVSSYFFEVCLSWFHVGFFKEMAELMQENGRAKGQLWASWKVTLDDLWQFVGVWYYMLAFEEIGCRRNYFSGISGRASHFGPRHCVEEFLLRGKNGVKGVRWFENMLTCFDLPKGDVPNTDPFYKTRYMWECCREHFVASVTPGWLLTLDESMVKWVGRGMPGQMVVPRKPTPFGLEIHTLCCSISGILVNFEVYEGKEAMESKEFVGMMTDVGVINKSTALTLRCLKPYFSTVSECVRAICGVSAHVYVLEPHACSPLCSHTGTSFDRRLVVWTGCVRA